MIPFSLFWVAVITTEECLVLVVFIVAVDGGFGGEEWRGLGDSLDRIGDLTKRKGEDSALDKSRKRRAVED